FTFFSHEEIRELEKQVAEAQEKGGEKKRGGEERTKLGDGEEALEQAIKISAALFSGSVAELTESEIEQGVKDVPSVERTAE
ncbi:tyrosine--tRNA ligase, partial [Bacillus tropicus]|nr:tyrosine--tRNA ligase [Bacillus tropicus]